MNILARLNYQLLHLDEGKAEHCHDYAQLYLPMREPLRVKYQGQLYKIDTDELGFMPPNTTHQCLVKDDLIVINIPPGIMKKSDLQILSHKFIYSIGASLRPLIELIRGEIQHNNPSMYYLFYYLCDRLLADSSFVSLQYIRDHFDEDISVAQLARLENYNTAYFNDWFKHQTGCTPSHYLRLHRLEKARELLRYTGYNITEIALLVGFGSNAAFSRAFKKELGLSPSDYRFSLAGGAACDFFS